LLAYFIVFLIKIDEDGFGDILGGKHREMLIWFDLKRKRDDQAGRSTKNGALGGKRERTEGKGWKEGVLILMEGETSRGADVVDMRWRRGIWDASEGMGSEDEGRDEFGDLVLAAVVAEGGKGGHRGDSGWERAWMKKKEGHNGVRGVLGTL
jgi:hypothetical protein